MSMQVRLLANKQNKFLAEDKMQNTTNTIYIYIYRVQGNARIKHSKGDSCVQFKTGLLFISSRRCLSRCDDPAWEHNGHQTLY